VMESCLVKVLTIAFAFVIKHVIMYFTSLLALIYFLYCHQISMSAKKSRRASVQTANAKIPLGAMNANAIVVCSTREKMTRVLVSLF
jgi:hypothetical protein